MKKTKEMELFQKVEEKLADLLDENNLVHTFNADGYPIFLSVSQNMDPSAQMELFDTSKDGVSARDAKLKFIFRDGEILVRTDSRLIIPDSIMSKVKGYAKKMHYLYLQSLHHSLKLDAPRVTDDDSDTEDEHEE